MTTIKIKFSTMIGQCWGGEGGVVTLLGPYRTCGEESKVKDGTWVHSVTCVKV